MASWTEDQQAAIESRNSNLLVAAAAGSGKTAVLVERIIQLILRDHIHIDQMLIVTFTNAAAGEMRERIGAALLEELEKKNENERHLRKQVNLLNKASISTLHSFCIDVVGKYFHLIDIDPNFRIADTTETAILKLEAVEELLEEEYEKADEHFLELVERFGGNKEDTPLQDLLLNVYEFIQSKPYPLQWLNEKTEEFSLNEQQLKDHLWYKVLIEQIRIELSGAKHFFEQALDFSLSAGGPVEYQAPLEGDIQIIEDLLEQLNQDLFLFYEKIIQVNHQRLGRTSKETNEEIKEEVKALREQGKKIIKEIQENFLTKHPGEYVKDINELFPYMSYLVQLVANFGRIFQSKKLDKGILDFNDLEHFALQILENEEAAREYQNKFLYIFVDEYQDSNIVQETILSFIKREQNLFMVGDVKQSIYRFRLADPSLFIDKYESFQSEENGINRKIDLSQNFRSREEVIHGVNYLFNQIMSKEFGEIAYDTKAQLYQGAEAVPLIDPEIEVNILEKKASPDITEEEIEELENVEAEAKIAVLKIKEWIGKEIYDQKMKQYRSVTYRDIVVLLRTTKGWAQSFSEVFADEGIPVYADVNTGYFEALEIQIFMNLLKTIDNKRQDIPLLSVMRSVIGGFSVEELIRIRIGSQAKTYYEALDEYRMRENDALKLKIEAFLDKLMRWKEESRYMQLDDFIWKLFLDSGYYYYVGAMPDGIRRQANLRVLMDRAGQFQKTSIKGLFNFIKFVDRLKESSGDMGTAKTIGENEDVVRIMSIHKSKGLEFPVVIIAGMGKQFNLRDINDQVILHKDLGIGPRFVDPERRIYTDTLAKIAMKNKIKLESLSEEMRILYVALTRAREKLILIGSVKELMGSSLKWKLGVSPYLLSKGRNYLDWLLPVLLKHQDGENLREWTGVNWSKNRIIEDSSKWKFRKWNKSEIQTEELKKKLKKDQFIDQLEQLQLNPTPFQEFVEQRLSWKYGNDEATRIPSKLSVTEIKKLSGQKLNGMEFNISSMVKVPNFMEGKKPFSAMEKGIIIHFIMQHLDLAYVSTLDEIKQQINEMINRELLTEEEAATVDLDKILRFFENPIGKRILTAKKISREVPFNLMKRSDEIIPETVHHSENLLIQGVIDLYFEEEDGLVLIDYKTDYVYENNKEEIAKKYQTQMDLYREAIEKITGKKVKESYLYLFHLDQEVRL